MLEVEQVFEVSSSLVHENWFMTNNDWTSFIQRNYPTHSPMESEVEWLVGPIPKEGSGTEVVMTYSPNLMTKTYDNDKDVKQEFWTDSNGRQMIKRVQDTRFSYNLDGGEKSEPVSSNYYPINTGKKFLFRKVTQHVFIFTYLLFCILQQFGQKWIQQMKYGLF